MCIRDRRLVALDELREGLYVVFQTTVKRAARNVLRHQPGERQADWPQQQQRREHPIQDLAKQRVLLAPKQLCHAGGVCLARNFFEAVAQATHGGDADGAFFNLLAQAVDVHLNGIVANLFTPLAQTLDELVFADQAASTLQ